MCSEGCQVIQTWGRISRSASAVTVLQSRRVESSLNPLAWGRPPRGGDDLPRLCSRPQPSGFFFARSSLTGTTPVSHGPAWAASQETPNSPNSRGSEGPGVQFPEPVPAWSDFGGRGRLKAASPDTAKWTTHLLLQSWGRGWVCLDLNQQATRFGMDDIVERLRARSSDLAHEAAEEIERLRRATKLRVVSASPPPAFDGENEDKIAPRAVVPLCKTWGLPDSWGKDSELLGWTGPMIMRQAELFRQYWVSGKGAGTRRSLRGWRQSWSAWLQNAERYGRTG